MDILKKTAIVILAHSDFEALEISLYLHSENLNEDVDIYILQNGRGTYDCDRTYQVAKRYENLYPRNIQVVDWIEPNEPYAAISKLLNSKDFKKYDYICKLDDDIMPLRKDWISNLAECYIQSYEKYGDKLGYVTGIVNNNSWGFVQILDKMNLKEEYLNRYARDHYSGKDEYFYGNEKGKNLLDKSVITYGSCTALWGIPYISRWLHSKTTLNVDEYLSSFNEPIYKEVDNSKRYSINCMFFKKDFWNNMYDERIGPDDEHLAFMYTYKNDIKIIATFNVPLVHISFFVQKDENKDIIDKIKDYYEKRINAPYPISISKNRDIENEKRLKFLERKIDSNKLSFNNNLSSNNDLSFNKSFILFGILSNYRYIFIYIFGIRITIKKR